MKRLHLNVLAASVFMVFASSASALETYVNGDYTYMIINDEDQDGNALRSAHIAKYAGSDIHVTIPVEVEYEGNTYKVTQIEEKAFNCIPELQTVTIPDGIIYVSPDAFYRCPDLWWVEFPETTMKVMTFSVAYCDSHRRLIVPPGVTTLIDYSINGQVSKAVIDRNVTLVDNGIKCSEGLKAIYMLPEKTPKLEGNLSGGYNDPDVTVFVPNPDLEEFQNPSAVVDGTKWNYIYFQYKKVPSVFTFFFRDSFEVDENGSVELSNRMFNVDNVEITDIEWISDNAGVVVEDGVAKGVEGGVSANVTVNVYDSEGNVYSDSIPVRVSKTNAIDGIDVGTEAIEAVYNLNGVLMGSDADNLPEGIYIVKKNSGYHKIYVK